MSGYKTFIARLESLEDPRNEQILYPLTEVLFIVYASILSGYTTWKGMEDFARFNADWFRQILPYKWGFPSHYTIRNVCMLVDPDALTCAFIDWMKDIVAAINANKMGPPSESEDHVVALDGKALRGSLSKKGDKMLHIVTAYSSELSLVLGLEPVETKSNEIKAIPKILETLMVEGALISVDAIGCQKSICKKILEKKADYLLCVKKKSEDII